MKIINKIFHLEFNRWLIEVKVADQTKGLFHVHFLNEVPDLILEKSIRANGEIIWRSITDDMKEMAAPIGKLIDNYLTAIRR